MRAGGVLRNAAMWTALITGVVVAMLYLNSAAYSAWVAGGPPTDVPGWWLHRAFAQLCFAGVAFALGFAVFLTVRARHATSTAVVLAALAVALMFAPRARAFLLVDRCLDSGGRWNATVFACQQK